MNWWCLIVAVVCWFRGGWLIPNTYDKARSAVAPYRAVRGVLFVVLGWGWFLAAIGVRVAVVLGS